MAGTATADALLELRPHIRHCATCRATIRELHATRLGRLTALLPVPALIAPLRWVRARFSRDASVLEMRRNETVAGPDLDRGSSDLIGGTLRHTGDALAGLKQHATGAYARVVDPSPLAAVRPGAAAAAVAGCLALGGGATYCVTEGVDPVAGLTRVVASGRERKQTEPPKRHRTPKRVSAISTPAPTPVAVPTAAPPEAPSPTAEPTPQPTPEPTPRPIPEEEYEPLGAAAAANAPNQSQPAPSRTPAPAPAGGAGEFDGP